MNIEQLFLRTLDDLKSRAASNDEYEILGASALLRKLLLDEAPLMDQVNRKYRLKIEFEIVDVEKIEQELRDAGLFGTDPRNFSSVQVSLDPAIMPNTPTKRVKRDAFLRTGVQTQRGLDGPGRDTTPSTYRRCSPRWVSPRQ